jgi:hypothetical protein
MADDESVRFDQFDKTLGTPKEISDPAIVPRYESIRMAPTNGVSLIKGNFWPGIQGLGLTHKSPNLAIDASGRPALLRLMLKVDLSQTQPGF